MNKKLAIVGVFFDGYYDLWEDFLELFEKNWPDCPFPLYIVDLEKQLSFNKKYNVTVINAGADAEYSKKIQKAISDIDADYYLLLLEDFFISKPVTTKEVQELFEIIQSRDIFYYALPAKEFSSGITVKREFEQEYPYMKRFREKDEYTVSCQPAIWKKEFLAKCIGTENYNAWIFEGMYMHSKTAHTEEFLSGLRIDYRNVLNIRHGAVQGKILPTVYKDIVDTGYQFKTQREILSDASYAKHIRKQKFKAVIPLPLQRILKKLIPVSSVTEKYKAEVLDTMKKMGIE